MATEGGNVEGFCRGHRWLEILIYNANDHFYVSCNYFKWLQVKKTFHPQQTSNPSANANSYLAQQTSYSQNSNVSVASNYSQSYSTPASTPVTTVKAKPGEWHLIITSDGSIPNFTDSDYCIIDPDADSKLPFWTDCKALNVYQERANWKV